MFKTAVVSLVAAISAFGQTPTPPGQPTTGPGGSTYPYTKYVKLGPYYSSASQAPHTTYYIFEPKGEATPKSIPVVLFLHGDFAAGQGYPQGDSPSNYIYWIVQLVKNGYTVIYPYYDEHILPSQFVNSIEQAWGAGIALLQSGAPGLIPPASDALGMETGCVGHSLGAVECFALTQQLTLNPVAGIPVPRAIAAFTPGLGKSGLSINFDQISPTVCVVLVDGEENSQDVPTAEAIWASMQGVISPENSDFLEVESDYHGSPSMVASHWFPDTDGWNDDDSGVDDRDYNVTWKLSVGLLDCVFTGNYCDYGLGHGSANQIWMGVWSDGVPVTPLEWNGSGDPSKR